MTLLRSLELLSIAAWLTMSRPACSALVALQETPAGELADLLAHQLLLVIAIAQALLQRVGGIPHLVEQIVRAQPAAVVGKLWVGLHQVMAAGRAQREQAAGGRARVGRAHGDAVRRAAGGVDHPRAVDRAIVGDVVHGTAHVAVGGLGHGCDDAAGRIDGDVGRTTDAAAARAGGRRLRAADVEVGHHRTRLHVGCIAALIEVAQVADIDGQRAATGERAAHLADLLGDRRVAPAARGAVVGRGHVVEAVGAVQRVGQVGDIGIVGEPADAQVAASGDACVCVMQGIGADAQRTAGMDHRFRARTGLQHVFDDGARGHAIAFVIAQLTAAGALRIQQDVIGIGISPLRPQLHAVGGAGAVGVGVVERIACVMKRGRAGMQL